MSHTLVLFAKTPITGKVKTRLCPPLSAEQARQVADILIEKSIENVMQHWPGNVELCLWPDMEDRRLTDLGQRYDLQMSVQVPGGLGEKMYAAMVEKSRPGQSVMIMGCDVPHCPAHVLAEAFEALEHNKNMIGPTLDGGYYCIGVQRSHPEMFAGVEWGTDKAYRRTLSSCNAAGIQFDVCLPQLRDLDTFDDLLVISSQLPELEPFCLK